MEKITLNWFIKKLAICSIFLLLFITTHSEAEEADLDLDAMGYHNIKKPVKPGYSRLTIKREKNTQSATSKANIRVNDKKIAKLPNGKATIYDIQSGGTTVSVTAFMVPGKMSILFDAEPGESYLIQVIPRLAYFGIPGAIDLRDATIKEDTGPFKLILK